MHVPAAGRQERRDDRKASVAARFDAIKEKHAERKAAFDEARETASAQFTSATKEMMA